MSDTTSTTIMACDKEHFLPCALKTVGFQGIFCTASSQDKEVDWILELQHFFCSLDSLVACKRCDQKGPFKKISTEKSEQVVCQRMMWLQSEIFSLGRKVE